MTTCDLARPDLGPCDDSPSNAVIVRDRTGASATGCVRHGAAALRDVSDSTVHPGPGARPGDAVQAYRLARDIPCAS